MSKSGACNLPGLKNSVKKTALIGNLKRRAAVPDGSSPQLRAVKRTRPAENHPEQEEPRSKRMATNDSNVLEAIVGIQGSLNSINERLKNAPSKDDLTQVEISIGERISANSRRLTRLEAQCQRDKTEVRKHVEHLVTSRISEIRSSGLLTSTYEEKRNAAYMLARRSMRIWPVEEEPALIEACRNFFKRCLLVPQSTYDNIVIESAVRLEQGRRSKIEKEVKIAFENQRERDIIQSYALNLANLNGRAGIRLSLIHI